MIARVGSRPAVVAEIVSEDNGSTYIKYIGACQRNARSDWLHLPCEFPLLYTGENSFSVSLFHINSSIDSQ